MDLGAYAQIQDLEHIMKENNIYVPRLRGLRLMRNEEPISDEDIQQTICDVWLDRCDDILRWDGFGWTYSTATDRKSNKYLYHRGDVITGIRWDRVHGKLRKRFKYELKQVRKQVTEELGMFNKYAGKDVLYIHARIGGANWIPYEGNELMKEPWFLEKVDDCVDNTYCDIYARIEDIPMEYLESGGTL